MTGWTDDHELCQREAEELRAAGRRLADIVRRTRSTNPHDWSGLRDDSAVALAGWLKVDPL